MARIGPGDVALTMDDLRVVARYAVESAEEALPLFEQRHPDDGRPRAAVEAAWEFVDGAERSIRQRVTAMDAHRAAKGATTEAAQCAAHAAGDAAAAAYLHPIARATQVGHILRAAAYAARAAESAADDAPAVGDRHIEHARRRATPALVDVLHRYPPAPHGRSRVAQLMKALDTSLRSPSMRLHPGEPEAVDWRVVTVVDAVRELCDGDVIGRPRMIGIDGRGGAGKSFLAARLLTVVPNSAIVHTDDIAWRQACFDWAAILAENVLRPLHRGAAVDFRPDAWVAHGRAGSITVPAGLDVVWVEGSGVIRDQLAPWWDASVWMQGDRDAQEHRVAVRDGDSPEQRENVANWLREELPFMLREQPWARATMIVAGPAHLEHDPDTELVVAPPTAGSSGGSGGI